MRRLAAMFTMIALLLAGCGGGSDTVTGAAPSTAAGTGTGTGAGTASAAPIACPTENTRSFAKTRFVADLGGTAFLVRRYIYQPYQAGQFQQGADGRTLALVKAAAAAAASVKLLNNATENAKANPTLCRTLAQPLAQLTSNLNGLAGSLRSGNINPALIGGLGGAVTSILNQSGQAGVPVTEQPTGLG